MGIFDQATRKLAGSDDPRHLKSERLAGHYDVYEGYEEDAGGRARRLARSASLAVEAALQREALVMGAVGLAVGLAIGVTLNLRRNRA